MSPNHYLFDPLYAEFMLGNKYMMIVCAAFWQWNNQDTHVNTDAVFLEKGFW